MIQSIAENLNKENIKNETKLLCAVSGGIDSTVMLFVLKSLAYENCIVAHCNFKLRAKDSDEDEKFVENMAKYFNYNFISKSFNTELYAKKNNISIQMAARELRFNWFYELADNYNIDYICLAHNSDDQCETLLTNLIRGTGIRGLCAMSFLKDKLLRPLIYTSREEIQNYADSNLINYRIDKTNQKTKYSRNKIRHKIIPLMEIINPNAKNNINNTIKYLSDTEKIYNNYITEFRNNNISRVGQNNIIIDLANIKNYIAYKTVLFESILAEGIEKNIANEAVKLLESTSGKQLLSTNNQILKDRNKIIIRPKIVETNNSVCEIKNLTDFLKYNIHYSIVEIDNLLIDKNNRKKAYFDFDKLNLPLLIRPWKTGDKFMPFGMNNFKKISDFLIDEKLSLFEKEDIKVVENKNDIIWVLGYRADNRYKITKSSKKILVLSVE